MLESKSPYDDTAQPLDEAATLRTLNAFAVAMIAIPSVEDLFWYVAQNVVGRLNFVDCVIYEVTEDRSELMQVAALGEKNPFGRSILNPLNMQFGEGITGQVAQTGKAIVVDDLLRDQNYIPDTKPARSEICVPLMCGGRIVGVIDSEHPDPEAFGEAELEVLITIAAMTGAKLELLAEAEKSNQRYTDLVESHAQISRAAANRKTLEAELHSARKLEAIGRLTGQFAHEFNNLLTVISGNLELIEGDISQPVALESWRDAQAAANRGGRLIQDMLSFSQRTHLKPEMANLNELIASTCAKVDRAVADTIRNTIAENLWPVNVDLSAFNHALDHLIKNAHDAMPEGGIIDISAKNIRHDLTDKRSLATPLPAGNYVCLCIQDQGLGISPQGLQQIYDPFYTTKPVGAGTGLGLSMTLGFMQQSGGTVSVTSEINHGSMVCLYFPAAQ